LRRSVHASPLSFTSFSVARRARATRGGRRLTETGTGLTHLVKALADWSLAHRDTVAHARRVYDDKHPDSEIR
jgi:DNA-binding HxlR family transcriptional regulator